MIIARQMLKGSFHTRARAKTKGARMRLGIDLGGTKISWMVHDGTKVINHERAPTPKDYQGLCSMIEMIVAKADELVGGHVKCGMGIPGSVSPHTGLIRNANTNYLNGKNLAHDFALMLGRPVALSNDANCLALSEAVDGAGQHARMVFAVILGTGCGGGIAMDGQVWNGHGGLAGEWGHNALSRLDSFELDTPLCWCGRSFCHELFLSGTGLENTHARLHGEVISGREIFEHADEPRPRKTIARYVDQLARGLSSVVNLLDPEIIILGGGLSQQPLLYDLLPKAMTPYVFSDVHEVPIKPAHHGDDSGVRGALWLAD